MIITTDTEILSKTEIELISTAIKQTVLSRFQQFYMVQTIPNVLDLYYVKPETNDLYYESSSIVDRFLNEQYRKLKEQLKDHYVVRKYTKIIHEPFKYKKRYHFIIENYSTYYDFYLECEGLNRSPDIHYIRYKLYTS